MRNLPTRRDFVKAAGLGIGSLSVMALGGCINGQSGFGDRGVDGTGGADDTDNADNADKSPESKNSEKFDPRSGGSLSFATYLPGGIEPLYAQEVSGIQIANLLFEPLVRYDYKQKTVLPAAATSWKISDDGCKYTFTLNSEALFHNGEKVTAADFKFSWERLCEPDAAGNVVLNSSLLASIVGAKDMIAGKSKHISGIKAVNSTTFEVNLVACNYGFLESLDYVGLAAVPKSTKARSTDEYWEFFLNPIGAGPYKMHKPWDPNSDRITLTRFDYYPQTLGLLKGIDFVFFGSGAASLGGSDSGGGSGDGSGSGSGGGSGSDADDKPDTLTVGMYKAVNYKAANLQNLTVGMSKAADLQNFYRSRGKIVPTGMFKTADAAKSFEENTYMGFEDGVVDVAHVPSARLKDALDFYGRSSDGYTADPYKQVVVGSSATTNYLWLDMSAGPLSELSVRQAVSLAIDRQAIVDEVFAGNWVAATGIVPPVIEGAREKAWSDVRFAPGKAKNLLKAYTSQHSGANAKTVTLLRGYDTTVEAALDMIAKNLEDTGFVVENLSSDDPKYTQKMQRGSWIQYSGWIADNPSMENFLEPMFGTDGVANIFGYSNPDFDAAIDEARKYRSSSRRIEYYQKAEDILAAQMLLVPLGHPNLDNIVSERINDLYFAPNGLAALAHAWVSI